LRRETQEKQHEVDQLLTKVRARMNADSAIDQAVRQALQKAKRNITMLQKVTPGIYKVRNKSELVMVSFDEAKQKCSVTFTLANGKTETEDIADYIKSM